MFSYFKCAVGLIKIWLQIFLPLLLAGKAHAHNTTHRKGFGDSENIIIKIKLWNAFSLCSYCCSYCSYCWCCVYQPPSTSLWIQIYVPPKVLLQIHSSTNQSSNLCILASSLRLLSSRPSYQRQEEREVEATGISRHETWLPWDLISKWIKYDVRPLPLVINWS